MPSRPVDSSEVELFRAAVSGALGLKFDDDSVPVLSEVLHSRLEATAAESVQAYIDRISPASAEAAELARLLSVMETHFLRHIEQFDALRPLLQQRAREQGYLRLLSAGCASGEETYSLAMVVREAVPELDPQKLAILGIDLAPNALDKARSARYSNWSLRGVPSHVRRQYFSRSGRHLAVDESIRRVARFEQHNLLHEDPAIFGAETYDVVFCRNVLMYFTQDAARAVVDRIERSLRTGGYLFLGHAETLRGLSPGGFHLHHANGAFFYEKRRADKPAGRRSSSESRTASHEEVVSVHSLDDTMPEGSALAWVDIIGRASRRIEGLAELVPPAVRSGSRDERVAQKSNASPDASPACTAETGSDDPADLGPAMDLMRRERFLEALDALSGVPAVDQDALLLRAALLVSSGDTVSAEQAARQLLELDELNAGAHYVLALCREHAGELHAAMEQDQLAIYLDRDFAMPYLHLGIMATRHGDRAMARRHLQQAAELLEREDAARLMLFSGGFSRDALIRLCRANLGRAGGTP